MDEDYQPKIDWAMAAGGAMGLGILLLIVVALTYACSGDDEQSLSVAANVPTETYRTPLQDAEKRVKDLNERLERAQTTCKEGPTASDLDGSLAQAEVDVAMAESIDNVSPEQEWRLRASLGAEMGLAPSQVDGWRDIYRGRAEQARRLLENRRRQDETTRRNACTNAPTIVSDLKEAELIVRRLRSTEGTE